MLITRSFVISFLLLASLPSLAGATAYTWTGGGATNNWTDTANWSPAGNPGSSDSVLFNSGSKTCIVGGVTVGSVQMSGSYSGTLLLAGFFAVNGAFNQSVGTFSSSSYTSSFGSLTLSGTAVFSGSTSLTSLHGPVSISAPATYSTAGKLEFAGSGSPQLLSSDVPLGDVYLAGDALTLTAATELKSMNQSFNTWFQPNGFTVTVNGDWNGQGTMRPSAGAVVFQGGGIHTVIGVSDPANCYFHDLQVNCPGGSVGNNNRLEVQGTLSVLQGTFVHANADLDAGAVSVATNATWQENSYGTLSVGPAGPLSLATGASFIENGKPVELYGGLDVAAGANLDSSAQGGLHFRDGGVPHAVHSAVNLGPVALENGSLTLTADVTASHFNNQGQFSLGTNTLNLTGDYSGGGIWNNGGTLAFVGAGAQALNVNYGTNSLPNLLVAKPSGTLTMGGSQLTVPGTVTVAQGSLDTGNYNGLIAKYVTVKDGATFIGDNSLQISDGGLLSLEAGSTFYAPANTFYVSGGVAVAAGAVFNPGTPLNFNAGSNQTLQAAVEIGDLVVFSGVTLTANSQIHSLKIVGGNPWLNLGPYTLGVSGDWGGGGGGGQASEFNSSSGTVLLNGSGAQSFNPGYDLVFHDLVVDKPSGTASLDQGSVNVSGTLTLTRGLLQSNSILMKPQNLVLNGGTLDLSNGELETLAGGLFSVASGASFLAPGLGHFFFVDGSLRFDPGALVTPGKALTFNPGVGAHNVRSAVPLGDIDVETGITLTAHTSAAKVTVGYNGWMSLGPYTLSVSGDWYSHPSLTAFAGGTGTLRFNGSVDQSVQNGGSIPEGNIPTLVVDKPAGILDIPYGTLVVNGTTTVLQGTFNTDSGLETGGLAVNGGSVAVQSNQMQIDAGGTLSVASGAVLALGSGGVNCYGNVDFSAGALVTGGGEIRYPTGAAGNFYSGVDFGDLKTTGGSVTLTADSLVHKVTLQNGWLGLGGHSLSVSGDWSNPGGTYTFGDTSGTLVFNGNGAQVMDPGFGPTSYYQITVLKPAGTLSLNYDPLQVNGTLNVAKGTLDAAGLNVTAARLQVQGLGHYVGGAGNLSTTQALTVQPGGILEGPNGTPYNSNFQASGTCLLLPGANVSTTRPLTVQAPGLRLATGVSAGDVVVGNGACLSLTADALMAGLSLTANSGLDLRGHTLYVSSYFSNQGTSSVGNGTVNLNGSHQRVDGSTQFQNLVKQATGADTLCLDNYAQQAVSGNLTLQGVSPGIPLRLRSLTPGVSFGLWAAPAATVQARYLDVQDANASLGQPIIAIECQDSGDNSNWVFATPTFTVSPTFTITPTCTPTPTETPTASPTYTATPTASPTGTVTLTATPTPSFTTSPTPTASPTGFFARSGMGKTVLAPVPAHIGQPVCLYFDKAPASTHWDLYSFDQTRVAQLDFGSQYSQCWDSHGVAPGIYYLKLQTHYADGSSADSLIKVMLIP